MTRTERRHLRKFIVLSIRSDISAHNAAIQLGNVVLHDLAYPGRFPAVRRSLLECALRGLDDARQDLALMAAEIRALKRLRSNV